MNGATLNGAMVSGADFQGTVAIGAKLQGTVLFWARNLQDADLAYATLPDGEPYRDGESLNRFTDVTDCAFVATYKKVNEIRVGMGLPSVHITINAVNHYPPATGIGGPTGQIYFPRFTQEYLDRHQQPQPPQSHSNA